jgi:hypothetical protein
MSFNVSNRDSREIYETAARMLATANNVPITSIDKNQLTQGYVETHANLAPNLSLIQFPIVDTQQVPGAPNTPLMRLLSMQDSFIVGSMSFYLMLYFFIGNQGTPDFGGGITGSTSVGAVNFFVPITYPQRAPNFFVPQTGGNPFTPQNVSIDGGNSMFWNSYLSYEVDKKVIIPYWNTNRHLTVPQFQAQPLQNLSNNTSAVNVISGLQQYDGATDGFYPVEPTIVMGGGRQNIWKLNLPANIPNSINPFNQPGYGTNFYLKACLRFHGILAQNSTSVK